MKNNYYNTCDCLRCRLTFKPYPRLKMLFWVVVFFGAVIAGSEYLGR